MMSQVPGHTVDRTTIACRGWRGGSAPATWGQYAIWREMMDSDVKVRGRYNVVLDDLCPPGSTVKDALHFLGEAVLRHESLRTTLALGGSGLCQELHDYADVPVQLLRACGDPGSDAWTRLRDGLSSEPFRFDREVPIRIALAVDDRNSVRQSVAVVSHHAVDAVGSFILGASLRSEQDPCAAETMQPLDEAEYQCGPAGIRMAGSALDYWRETLRGSSRTAKPRAPLAAEGTHQTITTLWSPSMYQAVLKIVSTTGFGSHSALLAAVATALAMVRERERVDLLTQVHNRFDPRLRDAITSLTQQALFSIDCPSSKALLEDDRSVTRAAFAAYQYGYYDKTMVAPVVAEVSAAHPDVDLTYWVNDKTDAIERASDAVIPTVEGCEPSTLSTEVCAYKVPDTTCGVRILSGESSLGLEVLADSARFGVDRAEAVAREIERVLLDRARSLPER